MRGISDVFAWRKDHAKRGRAAKHEGSWDYFATHTQVVLSDGAIIPVRVASLTAAKDLLAAQRAAERTLARWRNSRMMREIADIVAAAERRGWRHEGDH